MWSPTSPLRRPPLPAGTRRRGGQGRSPVERVPQSSLGHRHHDPSRRARRRPVGRHLASRLALRSRPAADFWRPDPTAACCAIWAATSWTRRCGCSDRRGGYRRTWTGSSFQKDAPTPASSSPSRMPVVRIRTSPRASSIGSNPENCGVFGSLGSYVSSQSDVQAQAIFAGARPLDDLRSWGYEVAGTLGHDFDRRWRPPGALGAGLVRGLLHRLRRRRRRRRPSAGPGGRSGRHPGGSGCRPDQCRGGHHRRDLCDTASWVDRRMVALKPFCPLCCRVGWILRKTQPARPTDRTPPAIRSTGSCDPWVLRATCAPIRETAPRARCRRPFPGSGVRGRFRRRCSRASAGRG